MPTTYLKRVAQLLDEELDAMVDKALHIQAFQYNGPDKEMLVSIYPDVITASRDILYLIKKINEIIDKS
ncbi:hypothetical protein [Acidianus ambivalens]|uniref:hypothetical protein n=1 Tax=Acidianus ambivalens TaxID=2283 RepID=UPI001E471EDD|nr:hypothetical protein [Acidianus ambivalens]